MVKGEEERCSRERGEGWTSQEEAKGVVAVWARLAYAQGG